MLAWDLLSNVTREPREASKVIVVSQDRVQKDLKSKGKYQANDSLRYNALIKKSKKKKRKG